MNILVNVQVGRCVWRRPLSISPAPDQNAKGEHVCVCVRLCMVEFGVWLTCNKKHVAAFVHSFSLCPFLLFAVFRKNCGDGTILFPSPPPTPSPPSPHLALTWTYFLCTGAALESICLQIVVNINEHWYHFCAQARHLRAHCSKPAVFCLPFSPSRLRPVFYRFPRNL